jgi:tRNA(His) guanylyltransferase
MSEKDSLGDRMKEFYENRTRLHLPRRTFTVLRLDGKAFHSYTRGLIKPFDDPLMSDMDETARFLCKEIQGAKFAYVQSDEISIILTDFDSLNTDAWYDGNIQKMTSVSASLATGKFNELRSDRCLIDPRRLPGRKLAFFDSRVFTIPSQTEVANYLVWRQQDTVRNSISAVAQFLYSHKELMGKSCDQMQEMIFQKGSNWNDYAPRYKRGRAIAKESYDKDGSQRTRWSIVDVPIFTQDKEFLKKYIEIKIE